MRSSVIARLVQLWTVHVSLTREVIIAATAGNETGTTTGTGATNGGNLTEAIKALRDKNQEDIGQLFGNQYGQTAGNELTRLLKRHIDLAVQLVQAALAGDENRVTAVKTEWYQNAEEIADFLAEHIRGSQRRRFKELLDTHLDCTFREATAIIENNWATSFSEYHLCLDEIANLALYIARTMSEDDRHHHRCRHHRGHGRQHHHHHHDDHHHRQNAHHVLSL